MELLSRTKSRSSDQSSLDGSKATRMVGLRARRILKVASVSFPLQACTLQACDVVLRAPLRLFEPSRSKAYIIVWLRRPACSSWHSTRVFVRIRAMRAAAWARPGGRRRQPPSW